MEITGKVVKLKPIETFQSGFQKRTVVVKTAEQYPQELPIDFLKDAVDKLVDISEGSNVKVGVNLKGNKYTNAKGEETCRSEEREQKISKGLENFWYR